MISKIYSSIAYAASPALKLWPHIRVLNGKEIKHRIGERFGKATLPRPENDIVWIHAASNGEALSALPLIDYFQSLTHPPHILMTTMTVTAADLLKKRVEPEGFTHQFIPYDHPQWIEKFHEHWKPNFVVWIESELWPNHLKVIKDKNIPAILANARLSDRSVKRWKKAQNWFQDMMGTFSVILAQTERDKENLQKLGLQNIQCQGNLKDYAPALPFDTPAADDIRFMFESRPCILYASTHDPEEKIARDIHLDLQKDFHDLLTVIVPRHPNRGGDVAAMLNEDGLSVARRSLKMSPRKGTDIYIADTLGELGLFYYLSKIVFVGNSMGTKPGGGHNLMEPAWHGCAIISGDDLHNFSVQADEMPNAKACLIVHNRDELLKTLEKLLVEEDTCRTLSENALAYVNVKQKAGMDKIIAAIQPACQKAGLV